ncbi:isoaspartyl peptidase/L-asparaginase [Allopusillimonas soli]|uniref:Isoaspartyl peptidase n=1 Tax=Allopusillimonas soli TaxID=659016 RepID=A0A853F5V9_9BURK|nr:isoaspartyl peptidase/L-asparaginase [Allopusillimonas soli]NYT35369.1 isoaspartyl peptidase/L-asparaginase [Allopusillimonas soli]TEA75786.1 isoaspartyl peptidase/L-asparaginase [Allopusillimonas soli]
MIKPVLAIHGGAGAMTRSQITPTQQQQYEDALRSILAGGERVLAGGGSALDAVTEAVRLLEECPLFNAGHGAVFTREAQHELDAAIMDGRTRACGAVANLRTIRNPVLAARAVMEHSPHVFFVGDGAEAFARAQGLECVDPSFFSTTARRDQLTLAQQTGAETIMLDHDAAKLAGEASTAPLDESTKMGTVGAVALDSHGNLAAATSTGGMTNKWPGRIGDSPVVGAGCYASNATCAVSTTGKGEAFIRAVAAYDIAALMEYGGLSLAQAADKVVHEKLPPLGGAGGLIAIDGQGNVVMPFNTEGMYRGRIVAGETAEVAIYRQ